MEPEDLYQEILQDQELKSFFQGLLENRLPFEEMYQRLLDFFRMRRWDQQKTNDFNWQNEILGRTGAAVPATGGVEHTAEIAAAIQRAIQRLKRSQHQDGGWGPQVEKSTLWHTAYSLLCLGAARPFAELFDGVDGVLLLQAGFDYMEQHCEQWSADAIEPEGALSIYDLSLIARCFYRGGREYFRHETAVRVYRCLEHLYRAQNDDGGWDASLWGYGVMTPTRLFSDVGATSATLQAFSLVCDDRFLPVIEKAARWLVHTQNMDGSWNDGSTRPDLPPLMLTGDPRINKTCDAIQGLLAVRSFGLPLQPYQGAISRAVNWLRRREQPVLDKFNHIQGWGWGFTSADYENTCHVLESFVRLPHAPAAVLASNANWLINSQRQQADDPEDGSWVLGHTARITCALVDYYRLLRSTAESPWVG